MISDFQVWKKIRMIGSAAMAAVYVASGKQMLIQKIESFMDIAAGAAIKAAGGKVSIQTTSDFRVDAKFTNDNI